jgi:HAMP domain-containing protein
MTIFSRVFLIIFSMMAIAVAASLLFQEIFVTREIRQRADDEAHALITLLGSAVTPGGSEIEVSRPEIVRELGRRLTKFIATGKILSAEILDRDLHLVAAASVPGLEDFAPSRLIGEGRLKAAKASGSAIVLRSGRTVSVADEVLDEQGAPYALLAVSLPTEYLDGDRDTRLRLTVVAVAGLLLTSLAAAGGAARWFSTPIATIASLAHALREGGLDTKALHALAPRRDEFGTMARAVLTMVSTLNMLVERMDEIVDQRLEERAGQKKDA